MTRHISDEHAAKMAKAAYEKGWGAAREEVFDLLADRADDIAALAACRESAFRRAAEIVGYLLEVGDDKIPASYVAEAQHDILAEIGKPTERG